MGSLPTIEMIGPAGRVIINATDRDLYLKKGYKDKGDESAPPSVEPDDEEDGDEDEDEDEDE